VAYFVPHQGYDPSNQYIHDIALVKLAEPMKIDFHDYKVRLPVSGSYFATGTPAVLAGWGLNATGGVVMSHLQKVDLQVFSAFDCNQMHQSKVHFTNICGGVREGGKGQCSGDSGGPLLVEGVQVGIVSWSVKPCTVPPPGKFTVNGMVQSDLLDSFILGVYTGVSHYIDWISKNSGIDFKLNIFLRAKSP
jgi:trypsin